ncbi:MAG: hypothetical protein KF878_26425 [Planctomycetes bacterium]|nr:hypothetical protein [Planctomycetota bacterium]
MPLDLFAEAGPLARGYLAVDWASTPLGAMATWPPCLRAALAACLAAPGPALLVWGPERVVLPNAACRDLLGDEAPAPGAAGPRWGPTFLRALLEAAHAHDRGARLEERPFARVRGGAREEVFVTCTCAPVRGEGGARAGLHVALEDVTRRVLAGRRAATLAALAALEGEVDEVLAGACAALVEGDVGVRAAGMATDDGATALPGAPALPAALEAARGALEPSLARASERPGVVAGARGPWRSSCARRATLRPRAALDGPRPAPAARRRAAGVPQRG